MPEMTPEQRLLNELGYVLGAHPGINLGDLARTLQERTSPAPAASSAAPGWDALTSPVLDCARAFGWSANFTGPEQAATILNREFGLRLGKTSPWRTLSGIAALQLLEAGPERARDLMRRYELKAPPKARSTGRGPSRASSRQALHNMVSGILSAEEL